MLSSSRLIRRNIVPMCTSVIQAKNGNHVIMMMRGLATGTPNLRVLKNDDEFDVYRNSADKRVYYFTASWCPPCRAIAPVFQALSQSKPNITFVKIDVDNLPSTAQEHQIQGVPTFIFMSGNKRVAQFSGAVESSLRNYLEALEKA